jgi:hypothetical protein
MYDIQNILSISFILVGNGMLIAICCSGQLPPIFQLLLLKPFISISQLVWAFSESYGNIVLYMQQFVVQSFDL